MSVVTILLGTAVMLLLAYRWYGRYVARVLGISNNNPTPAHTRGDGVDYVPSRPSVLLGHHFASIAGAGPIVGPIVAAAFGWVPALIWIIIGGIFFGAVHDLTSLTASLRHQGRSIGEVVEQYIGSFGKRLFLVFSFSTLVLIIGVFADIVAKTFVAVPSAASASALFVLLAVLFGVGERKAVLPFWVLSSVAVVLMYGSVFAGYELPLHLPYEVWLVLLFTYIFAASVMPVSLLLQPRDYLNSFLLYGMMAFGIGGILIGQPTVAMEPAVHIEVENLGYIFPVLFVTVACGAISGFHSLVASGTTSKQVDKEEHAVVVGFGGMLIETMLAVIALMSVAVLTRDVYLERLEVAGPVTLFSEGVGGFIAAMGIPRGVSVPFVALAVSAFALTTLDTCTRLARYVVEEYFQGSAAAPPPRFLGNRYVCTLIPVGLSIVLVLTGEFSALWPIFGSANQMLAALALLAVSLWLLQKNVKPVFTLIPMSFMFAVTLSSLLQMAWNNFEGDKYPLAILATVLFALALTLLVLAARRFRSVLRDRPTSVASE